MVVNYYDNYKFLELPEADSYLRYVDDDAFSEAYMSDYPSGDLNGLNARGLLTGTRTYLLDSSGDYTMSVMYYNNKGKVVQTSSSNHLGGHDIVYNTLDFTGNPTMTRKKHNIAGQPVNTELYTYSYDHASRLLETSYVLGSDNPVVLASNTYDELGRLKLKTRHNSIDTELFDYNIRSWFTRIKSGDFEENIYYNNLPIDVIEATPSYNGNISYSSWTYGDTKNAYQYNYDALNRFVGGYCYINNSLQDCYQYSESVSYDKMGNISHLNRYDSGDVVDQLTLSYEGNQLKSVSDNRFAPSQYGIKEYQDKSSSNDEFAYDKNGNMIKDLDRDIVCIRYNILNLPDTVQFKSGHQIINKYDASGKKLSDEYYTLLYGVQVPIAVGKVLNIKNSYGSDEVDLIKKHYVDNFTYKWHIMNQSSGGYDLEKVYNTEGYVDNISLSNRYNYFRKDHLGTNREVWCASFKENDKIYPANTIQRTQYYPSGLPWADGTGTTVQNKKYNGKEWIEAHGYDMYDYGARGYYPAIMRFTSVDPLAEKHYNESPYIYCGNNPINRVDPDGMDWYKDKDGTYQYNHDLNRKNQKDILGKGQAYVGKTYKVKDKNGNITINYRKDGSIMFANETTAYKRMWNQANKVNREQFAVIGDKSVLVLPDYKNDNTTSKIEEYGYSFKNSRLVDPITNLSFSTLATIHTHQDDLDGEWGFIAPPGFDDNKYFPHKTPNVPYFTMAYDYNIYGKIGNRDGTHNIELSNRYSKVDNLLDGVKLQQLLMKMLIKK